MHGQGHAPPPPGRPAGGTLAALRALFAALTLLSCGFLGWIAMIRLAVVTRRPLHWALLWLVIASNIGLIVFAGVVTPEEDGKELSDPAAITMLLWLLLNTVGVLTYYVYAELRHYEHGPQGAQSDAFLPGSLQTAPQPLPPQAGYGYPPAPHHTPLPQPPHHHTPAPQPAAPQPAAPQPPAQPPAPPHRIGQVRAELDELSELLRREERDR